MMIHPAAVVSALLFSLLVDLRIAALPSSEFSEKQLQTGHQRIRQLASHYEVVSVATSDHYDNVRRSRRNLHPSIETFHVKAYGKTHTLDLELNDHLLPAGHVLRSFKENGEEEIERGAVNCYYQGRMRGQINSHAVLSTCDGLRGSFGVGPPGHWTRDDTYFIEPLTNRPSPNGTHLHAVFRLGDSYEYGERHSCGVSHDHDHVHRHNETRDHLHEEAPLLGLYHHNRRVRRNVLTEKKIVELMLVVDNRVYVQQAGRSVANSGTRARAVANFVDSVYKVLNIRVALVAVEVWSNGDKMTISATPSTTLNNFKTYRSTQLVNAYPHDNAQLLTGIDFTGNTVGIAPVSGMCLLRSSVGANQDRSTTSSVGGTMAHEMGHNFGMEHDDTRATPCSCASTTRAPCIMASTSNGIPPTTWSSCSRTDLNKFLTSGGGSCLFNTPTQLFGDPVCGNSFVEKGEECDCGTPAECTDKCCDARTCRLTTGSQCASGECCSNCRFKAAGTTCRSSVNTCDIPESCTGSSHLCPNNLFRQNGFQCTNAGTSSYCFNGMCKIPTDQCRTIWGSTTRGVAADLCFTRYNVRGNSQGNCGVSSGTYVACKTADAKCGVLFCQGGPTAPTINAGGRYWSFIYGSTQCKGTSLMSGSDATDIGLVEDGTVCGTNSICISNQCRTFASQGITPCPSSGGKICAGNGVCTNLNRCLCNTGWRGTSCSQAVAGPVNGGWGSWTLWSECSHTCGTQGVRSRSRSCNNPPPSNGGAACSGASFESGACNRVTCPQPINGAWSTWNAWQPCRTTCGPSSQVRFRSCSNPTPRNGGQDCPGLNYGTQSCNLRACGTWSSWGLWQTCSASCGTGRQTRTRSCTGGNDCTGGSGSSETRSCTRSCTPNVNGGWSSWSTWSACSVTCRQGSQTRRRTCDNPPRTGLGLPCSGGTQDTRSCTLLSSCSNVWGSWQAWGPCSKNCGSGAQARSRSCIAKPCTGSNTATRMCNTIQCTVQIHGGWTEWSGWKGSCTPCRENTFQTRTRTCTNPTPQNGGRQCSPAISSESQPCNCGATPLPADVVSPTTPGNGSSVGNSDKSSGGSNVGVIVGVIVGIGAFLAILAVVVVIYRRRKSPSITITSAVNPPSKPIQHSQVGAGGLHISRSHENLLQAPSSATSSPMPEKKLGNSGLGWHGSRSTDNLLSHASRENSPDLVKPPLKPTSKPPPPPPGMAKTNKKAPAPPTKPYTPPKASAPPLPTTTDGDWKPPQPMKPPKPPVPVTASKPAVHEPQQKPLSQAPLKPPPPAPAPKVTAPAPATKPSPPKPEPRLAPAPKPSAPSKPPVGKPPARPVPVAAVKPTSTPPSGKKALLPPGAGKSSPVLQDKRANLSEKLLQRYPHGQS